MATIHDVARKARVSVMTVSRTLNSPSKVSAKTRTTIHEVMEQLGYEPNLIARSLVRRRTNTLGIIMPDIKNTFFNSWFRAVEEVARSVRYNLLLCNTDEDAWHELQAVRLMLGQRVDGIIIVPHARESVLHLRRSRRPFILVDRVFNDVDTDSVSTDHYGGAYAATAHLTGLGHRSIAVLRGPGVLYPDVERYRGFSDAMKQERIPVLQQLVCNCEFQEGMAFEATKQLLLMEPRPTAVFSFNSLMTVGVLKAMRTLNLSIPDDLSVVTYDEIPGHSVFTPSITYVQQPVEALGREATQIMLDRIERPRKKDYARVLLAPTLVAGESCASPRNVPAPSYSET
ncbi:MAG: LacI family DNA-binding transcriptional regulator [Bacteroidota bacterium]